MNICWRSSKWIIGGIFLVAIVGIPTFLHNSDSERWRWAHPGKKGTIAFPPKTTVILYAPRVPIAAGVQLKRDDMIEVYWPSNQVPQGALKETYQIIGKVTSKPLAVGIPILQGDLTIAVLK